MFARNTQLGWRALVGLSIPAYAVAPARPGTLNFIEGKVSVDGREVTSNRAPGTGHAHGDAGGSH